VTLLAAALWSVVILAGERRVLTEQVEHGWPLRFLTRDGMAFRVRDTLSTGEVVLWQAPSSLWSWTEDVRHFDPVALVVDIALVVLGTVVLAMVIDWRRRRARHFWQLSLRELAAMTFGLAVICGWWGSLYRETQRQTATLKALDNVLARALGGDGISDGTSSTIWLSMADRTWQSKGDWFLELFWGPQTKPRWFAEVVALELTVEQGVADEAVALIGQLPALEEFSLKVYGGSRRLSNESVQTIAGLRKLRTLELGRMGGNWDMSVIGLNDEQVACLAQLPNLERLDLSHNHVSDEGLRQLKGLKRLEVLEISNNATTDAGVDELRESLPDLQVLDD
jgi:hypothetical protein